MPRQKAAAPSTRTTSLTLSPDEVLRLTGKTLEEHARAQLRDLLYIIADPTADAGCRRTAQARVCRMIGLKPITGRDPQKWSARLCGAIDEQIAAPRRSK